MPRRPSHSSFRAFSLATESQDPLHRQLYDELRRSILNGRLAPGSRLPASRELAQVNKVSRNTVLAAYEQLLAEGFIESRPGSGTFVVETVLDSLPPASPEPAQTASGSASPRALSRRGRRTAAHPVLRLTGRPVANAFRPGLPALDHFPADVWRRLTDRRWRRASVRLLTYDDPQGYLPLREAVAAHLSASRGARCTAENVIIVNGSQQALDLVTRVLLDEDDTVWFEDPGYFAARAAFEAAGCRVVPVPVDHDGLDVAAGTRLAPDARLAYCTPSHQNPLGVTLGLARRVALLQWAERAGAWILEDDNASEYRYRGRPLAALQGIDTQDRVLYAGTFSKVLFSSLRLGYLVAPADLVPALVSARELTDRQSPGPLQAVVADFMNEGHFARHVRRMRTLYASRLDALTRAVATHASDVLELETGEGGMSRTAWLPPGCDDAAVAKAAAQQGLLCVPLSDYTVQRRARGGLVLGFCGVDELEIDGGIRRLAEVVRGVRVGAPANV